MSVKGTPNYYASVQGNCALLDCSSRQWMLGDGKKGSILNPAIRLVSQEQYTHETAELQRRHDAEIAAAAAETQRRRAASAAAAAEAQRQHDAEIAAALEAQRRRNASDRLGAALKRGVQNKREVEAAEAQRQRDAEAEAQRRQIEAAADAQRLAIDKKITALNKTKQELSKPGTSLNEDNEISISGSDWEDMGLGRVITKFNDGVNREIPLS
jgi:hypothetical protein